MSAEMRLSEMKAMYRRWVYMVVAIVAAALLYVKPVLSFQEDKGIIYVRSFSMDERTFTVTQTELDTGIERVTARMSVKGLYYCHQLMLWGTILCFLCFYNDWRVWICIFTALAAGAYYVFMAYYALWIANDYFATLYPNYMAILPAVVIQMMVMTRYNIVQSEVNEFDEQ